jgi:hypothetical protein
MNPDKIVWITEDGTWGTAPIIVLDTTEWTQEKWAELESKSDNRRELWDWAIDNS